MYTLNLTLNEEDKSKVRMSAGKLIEECAEVSGGRLKVELLEPPRSRMSYERQSEIVAMCLHCEKTGDWSAFEPLAREVLLEQLNLQQPDLKQNEPQKIVTVRGAESEEVSSDAQP